jgi:hypothetical protein
MNRFKTYAFIAFGWTILLCGSIITANARPFDRMVGCWDGTGQAYESNGTPTGAPVTSSGSVTWTTPGSVMHFKQITQGHTLEYDLNVVGKVATFRSADIDVTGTELNTSTYLFVLNFKAATHPNFGTWYNVHYFTSNRRRRVMGGHEKIVPGNNGQIDQMAVQRLRRVACPHTP